MKKELLLSIAGFFCLFQPAFSQFGNLDSTFANNGIFLADPTIASDYFATVACQADGKLVAAGRVYLGFGQNASEALVMRLHANGKRDSTFANNGILISDVSNGDDHIQAMTVQPDGKILVAGSSESGNKDRFWLMRLLPDGKIDLSFNNFGMVFYSEPFLTSEANAIELQSDGKILAAGSIGDNLNIDALIMRCHPDGKLDETFGTGGIVKIGLKKETIANDIECLPDGSILIAVGSSSGTSNDVFPVLIKLNVDGTMNEAFGDDGIVEVQADTALYAFLLEIEPQGENIVLATGSNRNFTLFRFNATTGQLDEDFSKDGKTIVDVGDKGLQTNLLVQPDGKILTSGSLEEFWTSEILLFRFDADGAPDPTFGMNGMVKTSITNEMDDNARGICLQKDGKIVLAGNSSEGGINSVAVLRYESGLALSTSEVVANRLSAQLFPNPATAEITLQYDLDSPQAITLQLFDVHGKLVRQFFNHAQKSAGRNTERLQIIDLPTGVYCLHLKTESGGMAVFKLLKM